MLCDGFMQSPAAFIVLKQMLLWVLSHANEVVFVSFSHFYLHLFLSGKKEFSFIECVGVVKTRNNYLLSPCWTYTETGANGLGLVRPGIHSSICSPM